MKKQYTPLKAMRDADMEIINKIAHRATHLYAKHDVACDKLTVVMDLTAAHFNGNKLRLPELLEADDFNFMHDIGGINRHLNRETYELENCFSPRFSA